jgi:hypothetical protein
MVDEPYKRIQVPDCGRSRTSAGGRYRRYNHFVPGCNVKPINVYAMCNVIRIIRYPHLTALALSILVVPGTSSTVYGMNADENVVYAEIVNFLQSVEYRITPHGA